MMASREHKSNPAYGQRKSTGQKLKDSCDMCSASKVKCDKVKPLCGRCTKLQYPCFYSPARRIGRPHCQRLSSDSPPAQNVESSTAATANTTPPLRQDSVESSVEQQLGHFSSPRTPSTYEEAITFLDGFDDFGNHGLTMSPSDMILDPVTPVQQASVDSIHLCNNHSQDHTVDSQRDMSDHPLPKSSQETCNPHVPTDSDCTLIATELLQQLNSISTTRQPCNSSSGTSLSGNFEDAMITIASVVFRTSVILTCTCSARSDVGLLCIAVSTVNSRKRKRETDSLRKTGGSVMRVLSELPRTAHLVFRISRAPKIRSMRAAQ
ncbi:hypothetical protein EJ08DRAFT_30982 [Tothia fuscella]|uniref:Zn(2)-C6 fungal-type domain-containing protein n=1 Tax=Tothia fuscella TaxID=1048955 RepID=A0A9P4NGI5_9PEZI|nr:hypothetical protein EJ08DRAFT_30982 [Tothia fuscella]